MSLSINPERITGIYAHNQWFEVKPGTVCIDSYELYDRESETSYMMGNYLDSEYTSFSLPGSNFTSICPCGATGIQFIEQKTSARISFALMEVRAFKEAAKQ
jgi:hypothetical protein